MFYKIFLLDMHRKSTLEVDVIIDIFLIVIIIMGKNLEINTNIYTILEFLLFSILLFSCDLAKNNRRDMKFSPNTF